MAADFMEKIETLLQGTHAVIERAGHAAWTLRLGPDQALQAHLVCLQAASNNNTDLLKIYMPVGRLPENADVDFFKDLMRKNRDLGHGGFALAGRDVVAFVDTLELAHCDQHELDATLDWLLKSVDIFKEKLDYSKLPYLDPY